ncbi:MULTISPECIES: alpha/beta hydrolase [unclassified Yoonia]|uniref:alpha/beta fold hydrolase n=1 Tax=unclassified Yoonia TaxID=2629118 RepID=UPI002B001528|nr:MULTISPECIES: alpha/beta hydrolase [unclassified Yoonia]
MALKALSLTALALGIGALLTACTAHTRAERFEAAFPPVGDFVEVTGGRVHYVQAGQGPDVILLHGAGGNLRDYTFSLMDQLSDRYRVTAFDRPGMGYTDRVPGIATGPFATEGDSPAAQVAMLREAAAALDIRDPVVVGHSFGGIVAMAWATTGLTQDDPTNAAAVVSFAGVSMPWPGGLGAYYTVNGSALGGGVVIPLISAFVPKSTVDNVVAVTFEPQSPPEGYIDHLGGELALRERTFRANARQVNTLRPFVVEMTALYPQLTIPIEIIHGTADNTVPIHVHAEELIKIAPTANLVRLDGVGHQPHHSREPEAIAAIDRAASRAGLR